jgi:hypothetical protein
VSARACRQADSVAEAEMMSRSAPAGGRQGGRGTCVSELQPLDDETVSANGSARCHFRFRLEQLAVANGGRCKCAVYKHLFKTEDYLCNEAISSSPVTISRAADQRVQGTSSLSEFLTTSSGTGMNRPGRSVQGPGSLRAALPREARRVPQANGERASERVRV